MPIEQRAPFHLRRGPGLPELRVELHVPDRHADRLHTTEKFDPGQDRSVVVALFRSIAPRVGKQPDPLVVADGMSRQSRPSREFAYFHGRSGLVSKRPTVRVRARSKSRPLKGITPRSRSPSAAELVSK